MLIQRVKFSFVGVLDDIYGLQRGEVCGIFDFSLVEGAGRRGDKLHHGARHEVFREDIGVGAGDDRISLMQSQMGRDTIDGAITVVGGSNSEIRSKFSWL